MTELPRYYTDQLLTYIGNKRQLLGPIANAVDTAAERLGKDKLNLFDGFSGSGVVSRLLKSRATCLTTNDFEPYAEIVSRCYLSNRGDVNIERLGQIVDDLNTIVDNESASSSGFIQRLYSPADDEDIQAGERAFYTNDNARRIDHYRQLIDTVDESLRHLLLGPLLSAASVHANTAGVFKGFYKDKETGIGKFGGSGSDALTRIRGQVRLKPPVLSRFEAEVQVLSEDTNEAVRKLGSLDLAYFDPPYNQHPYGSNYFMLNLITEYVEPIEVSKVSGIPTDWNRSSYNKRHAALTALVDLITNTDAKFILLSFNNEGFVEPSELRSVLSSMGTLDEVEIPYNTFRGSRNLKGRNIHVTEHLYLLERE